MLNCNGTDGKLIKSKIKDERNYLIRASEKVKIRNKIIRILKIVCITAR